jgi:hypothetical protein
MKGSRRVRVVGIAVVPFALLVIVMPVGGAAAQGVSGATSQPSTTTLDGPSTAPARDYNKGSQGRTSDCVKLKQPDALIPLRYADGTPRGYYVTGKHPVTQRQLNRRDQKALDRAGCPDGSTEIDAREVVDSPAGKMIFHPGGGHYSKYPGGTEQWGQYGHILLSDLDDPPAAPDPYDGTPVGNGLPCRVAPPGHATHGTYYVKPTKIDREMWYKKPNGQLTGARYENYGDKGHGGMYLAWNWVQNGNPSTDQKENTNSGGGYVRAVLKRGDVFERCDVAPLKTVSYGLNNEQNGWMTVVYGRTFNGKQWLYGWVIHSYEKWTRTAGGKVEKTTVEVLWPASRGPVPEN